MQSQTDHQPLAFGDSTSPSEVDTQPGSLSESDTTLPAILPEEYLTGAGLRAMDPSLMDTVVTNLVRGAASSAELRIRLFEVEDRLFDANDRIAWFERSAEDASLARAGLEAQNQQLVERNRALQLELTRRARLGEDAEMALSLLGHAVALLAEGGVSGSDPRVRDLVGQATRMGVGFRVRPPADGEVSLSGSDPGGVVTLLRPRRTPSGDGQD